MTTNIWEDQVHFAPQSFGNEITNSTIGAVTFGGWSLSAFSTIRTLGVGTASLADTQAFLANLVYHSLIKAAQ